MLDPTLLATGRWTLCLPSSTLDSFSACHHRRWTLCWTLDPLHAIIDAGRVTRNPRISCHPLHFESFRVTPPRTTKTNQHQGPRGHRGHNDKDTTTRTRRQTQHQGHKDTTHVDVTWTPAAHGHVRVHMHSRMPMHTRTHRHMHAHAHSLTTRMPTCTRTCTITRTLVHARTCA